EHMSRYASAVRDVLTKARNRRTGTSQVSPPSTPPMAKRKSPYVVFSPSKKTKDEGKGRDEAGDYDRHGDESDDDASDDEDVYEDAGDDETGDEDAGDDDEGESENDARMPDDEDTNYGEGASRDKADIALAT
ncbi:hypothetical protein DFQ27_001929, partial [Actinomortierella ambigua]